MGSAKAIERMTAGTNLPAEPFHQTMASRADVASVLAPETGRRASHDSVKVS